LTRERTQSTEEAGAQADASRRSYVAWLEAHGIEP
jgi:hypothetical protein